MRGADKEEDTGCGGGGEANKCPLKHDLLR